MEHLNKILEKLYNILGNDYLTDNFDVEPFEFKVNVRKTGYGDSDEILMNKNREKRDFDLEKRGYTKNRY